MRLPRPPGPPEWYWRLPLVWRQRYCRWFVWNWERVHRICTRVLTRRTLLGRIPDAVSFCLFCWREDRRSGVPVLDRILFTRDHLKLCWRSWLYGPET